MTNFSKMAAVSSAAGFQYYDVQDYSFTIGGQFIPKVSGGVYHHYSQQFTMDKNRFGKALTSVIMTNIQMNSNVADSPGYYRYANSGYSATLVIGSSGGFGITYGFQVSITSNASQLIFTIDVGNSSGVNDVTAPAININGKVFFYLAPF